MAKVTQKITAYEVKITNDMGIMLRSLACFETIVQAKVYIRNQQIKEQQINDIKGYTYSIDEVEL